MGLGRVLPMMPAAETQWVEGAREMASCGAGCWRPGPCRRRGRRAGQGPRPAPIHGGVG